MAHAQDVSKGNRGQYMQQHLRRLQILQQHLCTHLRADDVLHLVPCRAPAPSPEAKVSEASEAGAHSETKEATASEAVALIPDSAVITVTGSRHIVHPFSTAVSSVSCMCILACKLLTCGQCRPCMSLPHPFCFRIAAAHTAGCRIRWLGFPRVLGQSCPPPL